MGPINRVEEYGEFVLLYNHLSTVVAMWLLCGDGEAFKELTLGEAVLSNKLAPGHIGAGKFGRIVGFVSPGHDFETNVIMVKFTGLGDPERMKPCELVTDVDFIEEDPQSTEEGIQELIDKLEAEQPKKAYQHH